MKKISWKEIANTVNDLNKYGPFRLNPNYKGYPNVKTILCELRDFTRAVRSALRGRDRLESWVAQVRQILKNRDWKGCSRPRIMFRLPQELVPFSDKIYAQFEKSYDVESFVKQYKGSFSLVFITFEKKVKK